MKEIRKGEVYLVDLGSQPNGIQGGKRPVMIVQNNYGNIYSPTVIVAPITSTKGPTQPTHLEIKLHKPSIVLTEQLTTIPKTKLEGNRLYYANHNTLLKLDHALAISIGIR